MRHLALILLLGSAAGPALADPRLNEAVTQATIQSTICRPGWTRTIRPSRALIDRYERRQLSKIPGELRPDPRATVVDHVIPLSLGGAPKAAVNLQIQIVAEAKRKDRLERALHAATCRGSISLQDAQARMEAWR